MPRHQSNAIAARFSLLAAAELATSPVSEPGLFEGIVNGYRVRMELEPIKSEREKDTKIDISADPETVAAVESTYLSAAEKKILAVATKEPTSGKSLIKKAGYKVNSTSRLAITKLAKKHLLIKMPNGWIVNS